MADDDPLAEPAPEPLHLDRAVRAWWWRALLWLLALAALGGAVAVGVEAWDAWTIERAARAEGPRRAEVVSSSCQSEGGRNSSYTCRVRILVEVGGEPVERLLRRSGDAPTEERDGRTVTEVFVHDESGTVLFADRPVGEQAVSLGAIAVALVGLAGTFAVVARGHRRDTSPFVPSSVGTISRLWLVCTGAIGGFITAPLWRWWAIAVPVVALVVALVWAVRALVALEVSVGEVVQHRRTGRPRRVRLGAATTVEVSRVRDPVITLDDGRRRLRIRTSAWAARPQLVREIGRCLGLSGAEVPPDIGAAVQWVRGR